VCLSASNCVSLFHWLHFTQENDLYEGTSEAL
jgi:hypothetical protein